jgi:hypothetical protein
MIFNLNNVFLPDNAFYNRAPITVNTICCYTRITVREHHEHYTCEYSFCTFETVMKLQELNVTFHCLPKLDNVRYCSGREHQEHHTLIL